MSRSNHMPTPSLIQNIPAGIHLLVVFGLDKQGDKYLFTFADAKNRKHQEILESEKYVFKLLKHLGIKLNGPILKKDIINQRIWGFIKETSDGYKLFNTEAYVNSRKPHHPEDPELLGGVVIGDFTDKQPTIINNDELPEF